MTLPDLLLLGAPKAGTTALHVALSAHPSLCLSAEKEPKFFLTDGPPPRGGGPERSPLDLRGRFGTAFDSIDRPGG